VFNNVTNIVVNQSAVGSISTNTATNKHKKLTKQQKKGGKSMKKYSHNLKPSFNKRIVSLAVATLLVVCGVLPAHS
jgi:hypothetical protein